MGNKAFFHDNCLSKPIQIWIRSNNLYYFMIGILQISRKLLFSRKQINIFKLLYSLTTKGELFSCKTADKNRGS